MADSPRNAAAEEGEDPELLALEQELTKDVPTLLETMNRSSAEVNEFERNLSDAQANHRRLLEQLSRVHEELKAQNGSVLDRVRPYFDAAESLDGASQRVQNAVREFSAASTQHAQAKAELKAIEERLAYGAHQIMLDNKQQDGLSRATVRVLRCQNERDAREREYTCALREYQVSQKAADALKQQVGDVAIRRAMPCFRRLQQHQATLTAEQNRINAVSERLKAAKTAYNGSMNELDRISNAVHEARKQHKLRCQEAAAAAKAAEAEAAAAAAEARAREAANGEAAGADRGGCDGQAPETERPLGGETTLSCPEDDALYFGDLPPSPAQKTREVFVDHSLPAATPAVPGEAALSKEDGPFA